MIALQKTTIPKVLADNNVAWTNELLAVINSGNEPTQTQSRRYNNPEIKAALKAETHNKCAYCESKHLHVSFGDIEHVCPKAVEPALAFQWSNLTLACTICNNAKRDNEGYVDPYTDNPEAEFEFDGPMIQHLVGRVSAEKTKIDLKLNRTELVEKRIERLDNLMQKLERLHATSDPVAKALLTRVIVTEETADEKEYSACARAWVAKRVAQGQI